MVTPHKSHIAVWFSISLASGRNPQRWKELACNLWVSLNFHSHKNGPLSFESHIFSGLSWSSWLKMFQSPRAAGKFTGSSNVKTTTQFLGSGDVKWKRTKIQSCPHVQEWWEIVQTKNVFGHHASPETMVTQKHVKSTQDKKLVKKSAEHGCGIFSDFNFFWTFWMVFILLLQKPCPVRSTL